MSNIVEVTPGLISKVMEAASFIKLVLLLLCMCVPVVTLLPSAEVPCQEGIEFLTEDLICCDKCPAGYKLEKNCLPNQKRTCISCPKDQYLDQMNYSRTCKRCTRCKENEEQVSDCQKDKNRICRCKAGFYKSMIDSLTYECIKCTECAANERQIQKCSPENNTLCECKDNYYRVKNKCLLCTNCTDYCRHLCPKDTVGPPNPNPSLINVIAGVFVAAAAAMVLVVFITYKATKRQTKRKLLKLSSHQFEQSPKLYQEISAHSEEPSDHSLQSVSPHTGISLEPSNLPDCVPLELRIPEVIYTVLDLVPVMQMKQLVRSLGVTDAVIERAELDHRFSREAHYQMLRVWAEKGTHAGRGGQGGMLHLPLLHELLDRLRQMHLEQTAEELETKFKIQ